MQPDVPIRSHAGRRHWVRAALKALAIVAGLLDYVATLNRLAAQPEFYNALIDNCTTGIRVHMRNIQAAGPWDWRILANGTIDQMLYERGRLDDSRPFAELRAASWIDARARAADADPDFSRRIRAPSSDGATAP